MSVLGSLVKKTIDLPKEYLEVHKLALDAMAENQELLEKLGKMRDERDALKEEVKTLKAKADRQKELVREEGLCFRLKPDGRGLEEAPYCQTCWENDGRLYQMSDRYGTGNILCPECDRSKRATEFDVAFVRRMWQGALSRIEATGAGRRVAHE